VKYLRRAVLLLAFVLLALPAPAQTLEAVRTRGHLVCGATDTMPGFAQRSESGLWSGFDVDFCRAVAAAVFGNPDLVEFRPFSGSARFAALQAGDIALLARSSAWTLKRDTAYGVKFAGVSFFDGLAFMAPDSISAVSAFELNHVRVCLSDDADERRSVEDFFAETGSNYAEIRYEERADIGAAYATGRCDVAAAPASWLYANRRLANGSGSGRILPERLTKLPYGPVVREGDDQWFEIVRWTLYSLINAEELGITALNLEPMQSTRNAAIRRFLGLEGDFGSALGLDPKWMQNVIHAVGNYGELYARNFGAQTGATLPRGSNALYLQGGLLYAPPVR
jgi:general L-amino acid transport system substrate-binding protein